MNLIAMTAYNRPHYLIQVLTALKHCHGIRNYEILIHAEPGCRRVHDALKSYMGLSVHTNKTVLGCERNFLGTMDDAFTFTDFVIYLEDDVVVSPDFLAYMEWCRQQYENDETCFSISSFSQEKPAEHETYRVKRRTFFASWGFGMWRRSWEKVRPLVCAEKVHSWDMPIAHFVVSQGYHEMFPTLSRCQNIGEIGLRVKDPAWHRAHQMTQWVADCPPGSYWA